MLYDDGAVLGIDAAWTDGEPSGMALLQRQGARWTCLRLAPSWEAFCDRAAGWCGHIAGSPVEAGAVLDACRSLLGGSMPAVIAVDMPMAAASITGRREADNEVSRRFGRCKCAVHSPSSRRPGETGRRLQEGLTARGYALTTSRNCRTPALIEVYPHVALLGLTGHRERIPYKVGKTTTYWPGKTPEERKRMLLREWVRILADLGRHVRGAELPLPCCPDGCTFAHLKRFEDALDGLVCAWVATLYMDGTLIPLGDDTAAIWIPNASLASEGETNAT